MNQEIGALREEIKKLKKEKDKNENINTDKLNNNLNDLMKYFNNIKTQNEENKNMIQKMLKEKENENKDKEILKNYNDMVVKNSDLQIKINTCNFQINNLENKIESLNVYKNIVENAKMFKCKKCKKLFDFDDFKNHYSNCDKEVNENEESNYIDNNILKNKNMNSISSIETLNNNNINKFNPDKLKIKILNGRLKTDELGKPYLEYILDINYYSQNWRLIKKFIQFANLYKTIKSLFKGVIHMPTSSNIFVNFGGNFNGSFHENKIQQLEKFIKDLAEINVVNSSKIFKKFLEFDQNFDEENDMMLFNINQQQMQQQNRNINNDIFNNKQLDGDIYDSSIGYNNRYNYLNNYNNSNNDDILKFNDLSDNKNNNNFDEYDD